MLKRTPCYETGKRHSHSNEKGHKAGEDVFQGDECVIMGWGGTKEGGQVGHFYFEWSWMTKLMGFTILSKSKPGLVVNQNACFLGNLSKTF